jgi:protein-histidine pros-kinase
VTSWNTGAQRINGYTAEEIIGRHFSIFYPPEDVASGKCNRELQVAVETGKYEEEGWRLRKDGSRFWAGVLITALRDEGGSVKGFSKITRDLSERRELEQALRDKNRQLESAILAKDQFLASMSHELRTPLNAILGFTGTLLMRLPGPLTPDQDKQLRTVQVSARHLLSIINDILDLAKINSGKVELHREALVCQQVVQEVAASLAPAAQAKGLELKTDLPASPVMVVADRRALSQILLNLTNNALKYTDQGTVRIEVTEHRQNGQPLAEISVVDTGVGISALDQGKLFQPFAQVGDAALRERGGSGLGLHLSQRLAALMGGEILVESEYGRGSRFTVRLAGV